MNRAYLPALLSCLILAACGAGSGGDDLPGDPCSIHLEPGQDDQVSVQSALLEAASGSVICFDPGVYRFTDGLSLSVPGITLRSSGSRAILDFSGQVADAPGLDVTGDDFTVENLELRNTAGDAIRLLQVDSARLRRVRASWTADAPPVAGAHGIAILGSGNVLVEACRIRGAADAGVAIVGSAGVEVRLTSVRESGGGISFDESSEVELRQNRLDPVVVPVAH
ncbi:right-handed parallel beta-helix repeat-containing protein [Vulgatibacter incomptus]|nr:right-handed parallel beta-helix repeat-containing protein [Vulgatibacter incomptus]